MKLFEPKKFENYFKLDNGIVVEVKNHGYESDRNAYALGNCFHSREEAEFACERAKVIRELELYAQKNNSYYNWKYEHQPKWYIYYDHSIKSICFSWHGSTQNSGIYYSSEKIARAAVAEVGEERVKKFYFRVME